MEREREKGREKHWSVVLSLNAFTGWFLLCTLIRDWTYNFGYRDNAPTKWYNWQGHRWNLILKFEDHDETGPRPPRCSKENLVFMTLSKPQMNGYSAWTWEYYVLLIRRGCLKYKSVGRRSRLFLSVGAQVSVLWTPFLFNLHGITIKLK